MPRVLKNYGWPLLVGLLVAMLLIQRFPHWVGLPSANVNLLQAPYNRQHVMVLRPMLWQSIKLSSGCQLVYCQGGE